MRVGNLKNYEDIVDESSKDFEPLVSVGIPTYNRPDGLRRALESVTGQIYKNLEIIVSDNGSPDCDTDSVVSEFSAQDHRIKFFRHPQNKGPFFNFRFVQEKANGEYFFWLADDDYISPDFVSTLLKELELNKSISVAMCATHRVDQDGNTIDIIRNFNNRFDLNNSGYIRLALNVVNNDYMSYLIYGIYKTQFIRDIMVNCPQVFAQDILIVCHALLAGKMYYVDEVLQFREMYKVSTDIRYSNEAIGRRYADPLKFYKKLYNLHNYLWFSSQIPFYYKFSIPLIILKGLVFQLGSDIKMVPNRVLNSVFAMRRKILKMICR
jgi:glycosyltransferase domain-containing protein